MTRLWLFTVLLLVESLIVSSTPSASANDTWKMFRSSDDHYTIQYPSSWHPLNRGDDRKLDIINFPDSERTHGTVISVKGAEILVGHARDIETVDESISRDMETMDVREANENLPLSKPAADGCQQLRRAIGTQDGIFRYAFYYCSTRRGIYSVLLYCHADNPNREALQATALKVVLSLRVF